MKNKLSVFLILFICLAGNLQAQTPLFFKQLNTMLDAANNGKMESIKGRAQSSGKAKAYECTLELDEFRVFLKENGDALQFVVFTKNDNYKKQKDYFLALLDKTVREDGGMHGYVNSDYTAMPGYVAGPGKFEARTLLSKPGSHTGVVVNKYPNGNGYGLEIIAIKN